MFLCDFVIFRVLRLTWESFTLDVVFGNNLPSNWETTNYFSALNFAQNVVLFTFVLDLVFFSMSSLHRTLSLFAYNPFRNVPWIMACIVSLVLQVAFFLVFTYSDLSLFAKLEWYIYLIIFLWPIAILFMNELVKSIERKRYIREQKILKLRFETKLGMHSPY